MTKKKEKKAGKHMRKSELAEKLMTWMQMRPGEDFATKQIFRGLNLTTHPLKMLCMDILHDMVEDDFLQIVENGHYKLNNHGIILTGMFQRKSNGKNTFVPDDGSEPIFIAERKSGHAICTVMSAVSLMLEIPLMGLVLSLRRSRMMVPGASGLNVFLINIGIFLWKAG